MNHILHYIILTKLDLKKKKRKQKLKFYYKNTFSNKVSS